MFWEGRVLYRNGVRATFPSDVRWAVQTASAVVVLLGHEARVLSDDGVVAVPTPELSRCWALEGGVLAQGEGLWVMPSVAEGFCAVDADVHVLGVVSGRILYRHGDDVVEGRLVKAERRVVDMDQTMYAGIEVETGGWMLEPMRSIHLKG